MSPTKPEITTIVPHSEYCHHSGDLVIINDDTRFQIPSWHFLESPIFRKWIEERSKSDSTTQSSRTREILEITISSAKDNVAPDDLTKLCWVFFNKRFSIYEAPLDDWKTILRLANKYQFAEVKDLAFREISKPGAFDIKLVKRIVLYREYDAEQRYLEDLYVDLLSRPEPLTIEEGDELGMTLALLVSGARERLRAFSDRLAISDRLPESMRATVHTMVVSIFWGGPAPDLSRLSNGSTLAASPNGAPAPSKGPGGSSTTTPTSSNGHSGLAGQSNTTDNLFSGFGLGGKKKPKKSSVFSNLDD